MIVFISCTKKKANASCKAKDMYSESQWFRLALQYAMQLNPTHIYILSAKYGLLELDDVICPYEKTLIHQNDKEVKKWSKMVIEQIKKKNINQRDTAVFLCGKPYRKYLKSCFVNPIAPCEYLRFGKQMAFFKKEINK
jgi:cytoplasmic iron level regulating protein YaaA (DUF328/UPF0246 family)